MIGELEFRVADCRIEINAVRRDGSEILVELLLIVESGGRAVPKAEVGSSSCLSSSMA